MFSGFELIIELEFECLNAVNFIAHLKSILQMVCMKRQSHNYILSHILVRFDKHNLQSKMVYTIE